jgi:group I intron endonuclease
MISTISIIIDMFIFNYYLNLFAQFFSCTARALSLGLRLTANMIEGFAFILLLFFMININLDLLYFDSIIIIYSFIPAVFYENTNTEKSKILSENKGKAGIYLWEHKESGKKYVGSAIDLSKRLKIYFSFLALDQIDNYISRAIIEHGHSVFSLSIIEYIDISNMSKDEAKTLILKREQHYLDIFFNEKVPMYNILKIAGSPLGYRHSKESLVKISLAKSGENHPLFGKSHTVETRILMSEAHKSLNKTGANHPMFGRTQSEEAKALISKANKGKIPSLDTRAKMSAAKGTAILVYSTAQELVYNFSSARKAAEHFGGSPNTISKYAKSGELFRDKWILSFQLSDK